MITIEVIVMPLVVLTIVITTYFWLKNQNTNHKKKTEALLNGYKLLFKVGDKVHYVDPSITHIENGMIKSLCDNPDYLFVVYSCSEDWEHFYAYTAHRTPIANLKHGWK